MQTGRANASRYPLFVAGRWKESTDTYTVHNPYTGEAIGLVSRASPADVQEATMAAVHAFEATRRMPAHRRSSILRTISDAIKEQAEDFARTIAQEAGKPIKQARAEVQRSIFTFAYASEEANRLHGETLNLDAAASGEGRHGFVRRFAVGPVAAITPFNFPLNLVVHKVAPALAAGCPIVLKPASQTPFSSLKLAEVIATTDWPIGGLSVLPMQSKDATPLIEDERFKVLTFTGSPVVGWSLKSRAGQKRVMLELGGNAGVIIHHDADIERAVARAVAGGFSQAGQSCISVQRIFVHVQVYDAFMEQFVPAVQALKVGDPLDEESDLSSLITPDDATRVATWIEEARAGGAEVVTGGTVKGSIVEPTVLVKTHPTMRVNCEEVFAPVVTVEPYDDVDQALAAVNASDFGLQAGVFTNDVRLVWRAYETLEVGGVMINDVPTWRVDHMPYGGVKQSGFGREGLAYAIEEMTEPRLLVINLSV